MKKALRATVAAAALIAGLTLAPMTAAAAPTPNGHNCEGVDSTNWMPAHAGDIAERVQYELTQPGVFAIGRQWAGTVDENVSLPAANCGNNSGQQN
jgi:hypothetical protein